MQSANVACTQQCAAHIVSMRTKSSTYELVHRTPSRLGTQNQGCHGRTDRVVTSSTASFYRKQPSCDCVSHKGALGSSIRTKLVRDATLCILSHLGRGNIPISIATHTLEYRFSLHIAVYHCLQRLCSICQGSAMSCLAIHNNSFCFSHGSLHICVHLHLQVLCPTCLTPATACLPFITTGCSARWFLTCTRDRPSRMIELGCTTRSSCRSFVMRRQNSTCTSTGETLGRTSNQSTCHGACLDFSIPRVDAELTKDLYPYYGCAVGSVEVDISGINFLLMFCHR